PLRSPGNRGAPRPRRARALATPDASPRAAESPPGCLARVSEAHPGHTLRTETRPRKPDTAGTHPGCGPRPSPDYAAGRAGDASPQPLPRGGCSCGYFDSAVTFAA